MKHLTTAIAHFVERSIEAATATPGSLERDRARTEARVAKQVLDEEIGRLMDALSNKNH